MKAFGLILIISAKCETLFGSCPQVKYQRFPWKLCLGTSRYQIHALSTVLIVLTSVTHHVQINLTRHVPMSAISIILIVKIFVLAFPDAQMGVISVKHPFVSAKISPTALILLLAR